MNRTEMIERLVASTIESALGDSEFVRLCTMLETGLQGYDHMTVEQLKREMQLRGLLAFEDPDPDEDYEGDDDRGDDVDDDLRPVPSALG